MSVLLQNKHYVTQGYGLTRFARSNYGKKAYKNFGGIHPGIDFGTNGINIPCYSVCAGKVIYAGKNGGWGNYVEVEGKDGWLRQYAHLHAIDVKKGQIIMKGDKIGRVGTSGMSTGVHLHFGNRRKKGLWKWEYRDPKRDLKVKSLIPKLPTAKLVRLKNKPEIFAWTGRHIHHVPDMETLKFFFAQESIQNIDSSVMSKLPLGEPLISIK